MKLTIKQSDMDYDWYSPQVKGSESSSGFGFGICNEGLAELWDMGDADEATLYVTRKPKGEEYYKVCKNWEGDRFEFLNHDGTVFKQYSLFTAAQGVLSPLLAKHGSVFVSVYLD